MRRKYLIVLILITIFSCSKKTHPDASAIDKNGTPVVKVKTTTHRPLPKTLDVPDKIAMRSPDGRLYYDIEGHRYWKNYVNGKYYKFDKSMYNNPAFKPR